MSKHTPGPWVVSRRDPARFQVATVELFGIYSRHPESGGAEVGEPEADARLIAAAPQLLEALEDLLGQVKAFCEQYGEADFETAKSSAAVAKATQP